MISRRYARAHTGQMPGPWCAILGAAVFAFPHTSNGYATLVHHEDTDISRIKAHRGKKIHCLVVFELSSSRLNAELQV